MQAFLVDFYDSFSRNICAQWDDLYPDYPLHLVSWDHLTRVHWESSFLLLGPGPGHPQEYSLMNELLQYRLEKKLLTGGICLGHQLICSFMGANLRPRDHPLHGQTTNFVIPSIDIFHQKYWGKSIPVQNYHSLGVSSGEWIHKHKHVEIYEEEIFMLFSNYFLSYQFHPESIGTSCPKVFFETFARFLV